MKRFIMLTVVGLLLLSSAFCRPAAARDESESGIVYIIPIKGMIEPALLYVIRRGVNEAENAGADAIIFVMDTPGGTVAAASEIVRLIEGVSMPTYTFVEKNAFSAGAIIALATKNIYMAPGSVIGDAMPIMMSPFGGVQEMPEAIEEKTVSGVAALIRSAAEQGGHDKKLAEAMVRRELEYKIGKDVISEKGQLLTLTNVEAARLVGREKKPLLSTGTVRDIDELLEVTGLQNSKIKRLTVTGAEQVARFIAGLAPIFLIVGLLGIYIEIKTPGFGIPGLIGVLALVTFFWGHHIAGLAGMEDMAFFLIGVILLLLEIFVIPGFGVVGITGLLLILWAFLNAMIQHYPGTPWYPSWGQIEVPLVKLAFSLVAATAGAIWLGRYLPKTTVFGKLVLSQATDREGGFTASSDTGNLVGLEGEAVSDLHPAGAGIFGERRLDTVTLGDYINKGEKIRIVEAHGNRIVVERRQVLNNERSDDE